MFTFDILLHRYESGFSSWHILNYDRTNMVVLSLFQLSTRLNSQTLMTRRFIMNSDVLICIGITVFPIGIFEVSKPRK